MKGDSSFLDTNVFIYSISLEDKGKQQRCRELIQTGIIEESIQVSFQVIQEFIHTSKRKFGYSDEQLFSFLQNFLFPVWEIYPSRDLYLKALQIQSRYQFSYYDSLIISSALEGKCKTLYSEDLQHGQQIEGLIIINPFEE